MRAGPRLGAFLALGVVLPLMTGCEAIIGEPAPPVVFNILNAVPAIEAEPRGEALRRGTIIGVAPVTVPNYLDTQQIVTRSTPNTLSRAQEHQWGAPLGENMTNVLAENLGAMIPTQQVLVLPGSAPVRPDYEVAVEVSKFERDADGAVTLIARWVLLDRGSVITLRRSVYTADAPLDDYDAIAAAMSDTLARLSEEIAAVIRSATARRSGAGV